MSHENKLEERVTDILKKAVELDSYKKYTSCVLLYQEGIKILLDLKQISKNGDKRTYFEEKAKCYTSRAEEIKQLLEKQKELGFYHEEVKIEDNSKNHGYNSLLKSLIDRNVKNVHIEDPYIRNEQHFSNLLKLFGFLIKECYNLQNIYLLTVLDTTFLDQKQIFQDIKSDLLVKNNINFSFSFSNKLHDRQFRMDNGWMIKFGRGLDYFKPLKTKYDLGLYDLDFRQCRETSLDIFYKKNVGLDK